MHQFKATLTYSAIETKGLCAGALTWWNKTPLASFPGFFSWEFFLTASAIGIIHSTDSVALLKRANAFCIPQTWSNHLPCRCNVHRWYWSRWGGVFHCMHFVFLSGSNWGTQYSSWVRKLPSKPAVSVSNNVIFSRKVIGLVPCLSGLRKLFFLRYLDNIMMPDPVHFWRDVPTGYVWSLVWTVRWYMEALKQCEELFK